MDSAQEMISIPHYFRRDRAISIVLSPVLPSLRYSPSSLILLSPVQHLPFPSPPISRSVADAPSLPRSSRPSYSPAFQSLLRPSRP
jgi:hypothetical protein